MDPDGSECSCIIDRTWRIVERERLHGDDLEGLSPGFLCQLLQLGDLGCEDVGLDACRDPAGPIQKGASKGVWGCSA